MVDRFLVALEGRYGKTKKAQSRRSHPLESLANDEEPPSQIAQAFPSTARNRTDGVQPPPLAACALRESNRLVDHHRLVTWPPSSSRWGLSPTILQAARHEVHELDA